MVIVAWKCHIDPLGSAQIIRDLVTQVTTEEPLVRVSVVSHWSVHEPHMMGLMGWSSFGHRLQLLSS